MLFFQYAPFKKGGKSLAEKARKLGLQNVATDILHMGVKVHINHLVDTNVEGIKRLGNKFCHFSIGI